MWAVVYFKNYDSIEPIPTYWLNRDQSKCAWPNTCSTADELRNNRAKPNVFDFSCYKCRVLADNISTLSEATKIAKKAMHTSNLSNVHQVKTKTMYCINEKKRKVINSSVKNADFKRDRKNNITLEANSDMKSYDSDISSEKYFRKRKKNNNSLRENNDMESYDGDISSEKSFIDDVITNNDYIPSPGCSEENSPINNGFKEERIINNITLKADIDLKSYDCDKSSEKFKKNSIVYKDGLDKGECTMTGFGSNLIQPVIPSTSNVYSPNSAKNLSPLSGYLVDSQSTKSIYTQSAFPSIDTEYIDFQKLILKHLTSLNVELLNVSDTQQKLIKMVNDIQGRTITQTDDWTNEVDYFVSSWPIRNHESLEDLENKIKTDDNFRKQVVCELARTGGKSLQNMISKMFKKVFDDKVLLEFTYYGRRNKNNFSLLKLNKAIIDAVLKSKFKNCSYDDITTAIGRWLTSAKFRLLSKE